MKQSLKFLYNHSDKIATALQFMLVLAVVIFTLPEPMLTIIAGIFLVGHGIWAYFYLLGGNSADGYEMEHINNLKYKITNNLIDSLSADEKQIILNKKPMELIKHLVNENDVSNPSSNLSDGEMQYLQNIRSAKNYRKTCSKLGTILIFIGIVLTIINYLI